MSINKREFLSKRYVWTCGSQTRVSRSSELYSPGYKYMHKLLGHPCNKTCICRPRKNVRKHFTHVARTCSGLRVIQQLCSVDRHCSYIPSQNGGREKERGCDAMLAAEVLAAFARSVSRPTPLVVIKTGTEITCWYSVQITQILSMNRWNLWQLDCTVLTLPIFDS